MKNNILVIIVTYNALKWIDKTLTSVKGSSVDLDTLIIDNGSTDQTLEHVRAKYPWAKIYQSNKNLGFGKANNIGLKYAIQNGYEYIYLLNQDAWIHRDTISNLIKAHKGNTSFGILSPIQLNGKEGKFDKSFLSSCPMNLLEDLYFNRRKELYESEMCIAAHWLLPISTVKVLGGFSPSFPHYGEDNNYIHRLHYKGLKCGIVTNAIGIHDREERPYNARTDYKITFLKSVAALSNPCNNLFSKIITEPFYLIKNTIRKFGIKSLTGICKLVVLYPKIIINRQKSKDYAFLD